MLRFYTNFHCSGTSNPALQAVAIQGQVRITLNPNVFMRALALYVASHLKQSSMWLHIEATTARMFTFAAATLFETL